MLFFLLRSKNCCENPVLFGLEIAFDVARTPERMDRADRFAVTQTETWKWFFHGGLVAKKRKKFGESRVGQQVLSARFGSSAVVHLHLLITRVGLQHESIAPC